MRGPATGPAQASGGRATARQLRGDAGGRRPERVRRHDRPARADGDLRRLPRRRDRRTRWVRYLGGRVVRRRQLRWRMGMGFGGRRSPDDYGHRLLTLDGPTLYYQTNLGAVVALDAETGGDPLGGHLSPAGPDAGGPGSDRDLNPAIVHDGLVIVAPDDASAIFAFDADSGRLVWKTDPIADEVKLEPPAGRGQGPAGRHRRPRALVRRQGPASCVRPGPTAARPRGLRPGPAGRRPDLLADPERDPRARPGAPGLRAEPPIKLMEVYQTTGGNLAVGDGYLIVAQADALVVFCQNSRLIERYRDEIARAPDQAAHLLPAGPGGRGRRAATSWRWSPRAGRRGRRSRSETIDGVAAGRRGPRPPVPAPDAAGRRGRRGGEAGRGGRRAWRRPRGRPVRPRPARGAARSWPTSSSRRAGRADAVEILEQVLADERLRGLTVSSEDGHRAIRADLLIADRLAAHRPAAGP